MFRKMSFFLVMFFAGLSMYAQVGFETFTLMPNSYWRGANPFPRDTQINFGLLGFINSYDTSWGGFWGGVGYSNRKDTTSISYATNELASIAGGGHNNSDQYAVAYESYNTSHNRIKRIGADDITLQGVWLTNTVIAYRSMKDGDGFAKKFGGASGNDPDYFCVKFTPWKMGIEDTTKTVRFYLADFRDSNNVNDYIIKEWTYCDLSSIGIFDSIQFSMESSDTSGSFINTPTYFCMDDFIYIHTSINEFESNPIVTVFPNPCNDVLTIRNESKKQVYITINNLNGGIIKMIQLDSSETQISIDMDMPAGTYLLTVHDDHSIQSNCIIKR